MKMSMHPIASRLSVDFDKLLATGEGERFTKKLNKGFCTNTTQQRGAANPSTKALPTVEFRPV